MTVAKKWTGYIALEELKYVVNVGDDITLSYKGITRLGEVVEVLNSGGANETKKDGPGNFGVLVEIPEIGLRRFNPLDKEKKPYQVKIRR